MYNPEICLKHATCTNCPVRKNCMMRKLFYSPEQFEQTISITNSQTFALSIAKGMSHELALYGIRKCQTEMFKRRDEELKLHPTFSVD